MDRLDAMRLFVRVVESGSFSAAAREAGVGQPAVSKQVAALEAHLGAQLLQRSSRRLVVTEAGQAFYEAAARLVQDAEAAESLVGRGQASPAGLVRLTAAPVFGRLHVVPLLWRFLARYPDISVELSASERQVDLIGDGIDVAIRHGRLADSGLVARQVALAPFVTVAAPAYLRACGTPGHPDELAGHAGVVFSPLRKPQPWRFVVDGAAVSHHPAGRFRTADAEQVRAACLAGLGIAQAPRWLFGHDLAAGRVRALLDGFQPAAQPVSLVHAAGRRPGAKVRVLMDFLAEEIPPALEGAELRARSAGRPAR